jgi:hypothetical protein
MGQAKQRGTLEQRVQQALDNYTKNSHKCTVFTDVKYRGKSIFTSVGECVIPDEVPSDKFGSQQWEKIRNKHFGALATVDMYDQSKGATPQVILALIGRYLQHSATLHTERHYPGITESNTCFRTGHIHKVDLNNLGCVFEFELKDHPKSATGVAINTQGPKWMLGSDVVKKFARKRETA